jgi:hypothetical protein
MTQDKLEPRYQHAQVSLRLPAALPAVGQTLGTVMQGAQAAPQPFKVANIHFETNASACDMGIQIIFDTEGITEGSVKHPNGRTIYEFESSGGMKAIGGQTEGFLEGVEPQITELLSALGCEPSGEEPEISIDELFGAFPAGDHTLRGQGNGVRFNDKATLTHFIPAGAEIPRRRAAAHRMGCGDRSDPAEPWAGQHRRLPRRRDRCRGAASARYRCAVQRNQPDRPGQYLNPGTVYQFEILTTEEGGNQTISEGFFCTPGVAGCEAP